jgi:hypothetical protein
VAALARLVVVPLAERGESDVSDRDVGDVAP